MGKKDKKSKKQQDDYWDNEFQNDVEDPIAAANEAAKKKDHESGTSSPVPPTSQDSNNNGNGEEQDEDVGGGLMSALRKSKAKSGPSKNGEQSRDQTPDEPKEEVHVQVKSKKEKEREKKEREKLRKKQQAERKKADVKKTSLSDEKAEDKATSAVPAASNEPAKEETGGKSKKKSAAILALQKQMQRQREIEEEQRKLQEEEKQRILEEQRLAEEEEQRQEEARRLKKEREKQKKEELRSQGKLLTKKQREQQQLLEKRREALLQSGVQIAGINGETSKKPVYSKKKGKKAQADKQKESKTPPPEPTKPIDQKVDDNKDVKQEIVKETTKETEEGEPLLDSWEAALNSDGEVQGSWEDEAAESEAESKPKEGGKRPEEPALAGKDKEEEEEEEESSSSDEEEELSQRQAVEEQRKKEAKERREKRHKEAVEAQSQDNLRSPICCILGHVDTGKTKLLDKIRQTNVQEGEAGGITQQIGATYFPIEAIKQKTAVMKSDLEYKIPGLLIIDTPGHESFTNLRSRGSSLCNIAILVVDIMHGLEPQTLESIRLLRDRKTPFIVALNKIDRLYDWKPTPNNSFRTSLAKQKKSVQREFEDRLQQTKIAFAEQGLNSEVYYNNKNMAKNVSLVPTSAVTGEGVPDLLMLLVQLTQTRMSGQLMYLSEVACTVLEVKVVEGLGTTIDVVLSNGILHEGDRIVLCGLNGPIATNIRALLTPPPSRELRIKSEYVHHKEVKAALGVKIAANDLEKAVAGSRLLIVGPDDDEEELKDEVMSDLTGLLDYVDKTGRGVWVQASTLGSLEALLDFLKDSKIPVMGISLGPVYKKDVMRAAAMLEKAPQYAVMLCFDVKIDKEAEHYAEVEGVKIFKADIIYHLFDQFTAYQARLLEEKRKDNLANAIYPVVLKTIQIINKRNPMIIGVDIVDGSLRLGTPICAVRKDPATGERQILNLGRVSSLEVNHKPLDNIRKAQAGAGVAMRIDTQPGQPTWGRHVDETDMLYSEITRQSIDTLKDPAFRDTVSRDDWLLIRNLKTTLGIS